MTKAEFQKLLDKYAQGSVTSEERKLIHRFYDQIQMAEDAEDIDEDEKLRIRNEIFGAIQSKKTLVETKQKFLSKSTLLRIAAILALVSGLVFVLTQEEEQSDTISVLTSTTFWGQKRSITLNDGTTVRLNSGSSLKYPEVFGDEIREVTLKGEAYFDVTEDKKRPFIVHTALLQTTVLGTSFNVNAYEPNNHNVALVSGIVKVQSENSDTNEITLKPGQSADYHNEVGMSVSQFDKQRLISWKDNIIYFDGANHSEVFYYLERWYGVQFETLNDPTSDWMFSGTYENMSLELILKAIQFSEDVIFQINENKVTVEFLETDMSN
ncbi:MAG: FecR domain-containing protein [Bacteroidota bacterium]